MCDNVPVLGRDGEVPAVPPHSAFGASMSKLGLAALACYAGHGAFHVLNGRPEDLLWACHLGAALVGAGLLAGIASLHGVGVLFLCLGTPLWLLDLAAGSDFLPTSCLTHFGGLAIGLVGVRRLGMPRGVGCLAALALIALILTCRLVTPAAANVNLAFATAPGAGPYFPSYQSYIATAVGFAACYFIALEFALRRWLAPLPAGENQASPGRSCTLTDKEPPP